MNKKFRLFAFLWIFVVIGTVRESPLFAQTSTNLRYIYDEEEQLIGVIDENNNAWAYRYDAAGNLVSIERLTPQGPVDIFFVEPNRGRAAVGPQRGTSVTIHGIGFSTMPTQNQVTFNGVAAVVDAATATMIRTSVPAGATTGPVRVTSPQGMARSRSDFTVLNIIVTVNPASAVVATGQSLPFTATLTEAGTVISGRVIWSVNGVVGGNPTVGTIDATGLYIGPASLPNPPMVTVTATSVEDPTARGSARVTLGIGIGPIFAPGGSYYRLERLTEPLALAPIFAPGGSYYRLERSTQPVALAPIFAPGGSYYRLERSTQLLALAPIFAPGGSYYRLERSTQLLALAPIFAPGGSYITLFITGLNPNRIARGAANIPFTVMGRHLQGARALDFLLPSGARDSNITVTSLTASLDGTQVTGRISVAGAAAVGSRTVVVQTPVGPSTTMTTASNQIVIE